jgi:hypothetical protein
MTVIAPTLQAFGSPNLSSAPIRLLTTLLLFDISLVTSFFRYIQSVAGGDPARKGLDYTSFIVLPANRGPQTGAVERSSYSTGGSAGRPM